MRTVVLSGGDGFIGTHLSKYLASQGYEVYDIVVKSGAIRRELEGNEQIHIVEGNLNEYSEILQLLPHFPEAFFHFAWAGVTPDLRNDFALQMQNIQLTMDAVKLASELNAKKFVFPGSTMEYIYYGKPINKDAIPSPLNAYGVAKIAAKFTCSILCNELKLPFVYVVISSIYSENRKDNNVIYYTIDKLLKGEKPSLTKLEQLWDYVHIDDVVCGLQLLIKHGRSNSFYAIGHGDNWPLSNYIYKIRDVINPNLPLGIGEVPYSGEKLPCSCVDLLPIYKDTGYVPKISFEEGITRVIAEVIAKRGGDYSP